MIFPLSTRSAKKSAKKLVGVAAALMILPIAVACDSTTSTAPADSATTPAETQPAATTAASSGNIVEVATDNGSFYTLVDALQAADLVATLEGEGPFTVFAPTDKAFADLPEGVLDKLLLPENKETLKEILTYHVLSGKVLASDVKPGMVPTVEGEDIDITLDGSTVKLNNEASVVQADVMASNGVVHVIDKVLLPPNVDLSTL